MRALFFAATLIALGTTARASHRAMDISVTTINASGERPNNRRRLEGRVGTASEIVRTTRSQHRRVMERMVRAGDTPSVAVFPRYGKLTLVSAPAGQVPTYELRADRLGRREVTVLAPVSGSALAPNSRSAINQLRLPASTKMGPSIADPATLRAFVRATRLRVGDQVVPAQGLVTAINVPINTSQVLDVHPVPSTGLPGFPEGRSVRIIAN